MAMTPASYNGLHLGSWNVRSLYRPGAAQSVVNEAKRYDIPITALQEVRWPEDGETIIDGYTMFYSGRNNENGTAGTGFIISPTARKSVINFTPINERISVLRLRGRWFNITIINVYAPTEDKDEEVKDDFYEKLENVVDHIQKYDIKIVLGDFNAKIGREPHFKPIIGAQSLHETSNDNGVRCISLAAAKGLVVSSTMFLHKDIHKYTWTSPKGAKNQIDHVLIDKRHRSSIQDVRSFRGADCDSDHSLIRIKFIQRLKRIHKVGEQIDRTRYEVIKLRHPELKSKFQLELTNKFETLNADNLSVDEHWKELEEGIKEVALEVLGTQEKKKIRKWFTDECEKAVEERRKWKTLCLGKQDKDTLDKYEAARKTANKMLRSSKREFLKERLIDIEDNWQAGNISEFYADIRKERTGFKARNTQMRGKDGKLTASKHEVLNI